MLKSTVCIYMYNCIRKRICKFISVYKNVSHDLLPVCVLNFNLSAVMFCPVVCLCTALLGQAFEHQIVEWYICPHMRKQPSVLYEGRKRML